MFCIIILFKYIFGQFTELTPSAMRRAMELFIRSSETLVLVHLPPPAACCSLWSCGRLKGKRAARSMNQPPSTSKELRWKPLLFKGKEQAATSRTEKKKIIVFLGKRTIVPYSDLFSPWYILGSFYSNIIKEKLQNISG